MHGRLLSAGELARVAGVQASTMSEHLSALVSGGLLRVVTAGRHRYYELAGSEVAQALEALSQLCPSIPVRSLPQSTAWRSMQLSRLCYDHLAGRVGVGLLERMRERDWLAASDTEDLTVTPQGVRDLAAVGVDLPACLSGRRHFARQCVDWSERRPHLAGALGAALADALISRGWMVAAGGRGLRITPEGRQGLLNTFALDVDRLATGLGIPV
jgi:hypothetical protein